MGYSGFGSSAVKGEQPDVAPQFGSDHGYQWLSWRKGGMEYCAVSDVNAEDLQQLQSLLSR